jgi:hypothetical protein
VSATPFVPDEFSPLERAALARWRTPPPPPDFADRVLARAAAEAPAAHASRGGLAVAAFALILLGGVLSVRSLVGDPAGMPGRERSGGFAIPDAGPSDVSEDVCDALEGLQGHRS